VVAALRRLSNHVDQRPCGLAGTSTIGEYDVHAFVDGVLDPARRQHVREFLLHHPAAAAAAAAYCRQNHLLHELKRRRAPASPALGGLATRFARRLARAYGGRVIAWCVVGVVAVITVGSVASRDWAAIPHVFLTAGR